MKDTVLILTNSTDGIHSDSVITQLSKRCEKHFRLDVDTISDGRTKIRIEHSHDASMFSVESEHGIVTSDEVKSVWYRRPNQYNLAIKDPEQRKFAERELRAVLEGMWQILDNAYWISSPASLMRARDKILQLKLARKIGFSIPKTIITNKSADVIGFYEQHKKIVFKTIGSGFLDYGSKSFNVPTTLITSRHLQNIELVTKLPSLFQVCVPKLYDVRVTIVEKSVFAVKIYSQKYPETSIDWRHPLFVNKLNHEPFCLPFDIHQKCITMMESLGLAYGALDFVVSDTGEYFFLEINPNGQWYWIEDLTKIAISDTIAKELSLVKSRS